MTVENLLAMQTDMTTSIAAALQATLSPQEVMRLNEVPTRNTRAYEFYVSGNGYRVRAEYSLDDYSLAVHQYQRALDEDPEFALAWAGLARTHAIVYFWGIDKTEARRDLAREAVERAFQLAPELPEAHLAMGFYHYHGFRDYDAALKEFEMARSIRPNDPETLEAVAYIDRRQGRWEEALEKLRSALEFDPLSADRTSGVGNTLQLMRRFEEAQGFYERSIALAPHRE
ncbi:MAG: tetratricopeptide repeat protein, partial [Gammaproteobacteria bacterium]|nr:tetratricopeptide repeat protein [Gammaproteobacteria bacterium]